MKKIFLLSSLILLGIYTLFAQAPEMFKYQAVVRNNSGEVIKNQNVALKISILQGSAGGAVVYSETHSKATNEFGLVNLDIGKGSVVTGSFPLIEWPKGLFFIKIELDANNGSNFRTMGTSQLLSVPYALHAKTVENVDDADADPVNEIQSLSISGYQLALNKGGGSITLPASGGTGIQGVQNSNNTLNITNPNGPTATIDLKLPFSASTSTSATTFAVANQSSGIGFSGSSAQGDGIVGSSASSTKSGIWGNNTGGGHGIAGSTSGNSTAGVWGSNSGSGFGLKGTSSTGAGVYGSTAGTGAAYGISGESTANSGTGVGVFGRSASPTGTGVYGWANNAGGINYGVYGETGSATGYGGYFVGRGYFGGAQDPLLLINHTGASGHPAIHFQQDGTTKSYVWWDQVNNRLNFGTPAFNPILSLRSDGSAVVDGKVQASGYRHKIPKTYYYSIPPAAFQVTGHHDMVEGNPTWWENEDETRTTIKSPTERWVAPVYLPDGAVVTGMAIYFRDESVQDNVKVTLRKRLLSDDTYLNMCTIESTGSPGDFSLTTSSIAHSTISNFLHVHSILFSKQDIYYGMNGLRLRAVRIAYTLEEL